jgi:hypothetical protein
LVDRQAETRSLSPSAIEAMGIGSTEKLATGTAQVSPEVDGMHAEIDRAAARAYAAGVTHNGSTTTSGSELAAPRTKDRPVWPFFVVGMIAMLAGGGALMKLVVVPRLSAPPKDSPTVPLASASTVAPGPTPNPTDMASTSTGSQLPAPRPSTLPTTLPTATATASSKSAPVVPKGPSPKPAAPRPTPAGESPDVNL